mmetsp:Transcript_60757/g.107868  ORF Transcript_60757/g.107868 Transcript_60757/m.107868 type:complete len:201 (-) Transcript_60757:50-652(-)
MLSFPRALRHSDGSQGLQLLPHRPEGAGIYLVPNLVLPTWSSDTLHFAPRKVPNRALKRYELQLQQMKGFPSLPCMFRPQCLKLKRRLQARFHRQSRCERSLPWQLQQAWSPASYGLHCGRAQAELAHSGRAWQPHRPQPSPHHRRGEVSVGWAAHERLESPQSADVLVHPLRARWSRVSPRRSHGLSSGMPVAVHPIRK